MKIENIKINSYGNLENKDINLKNKINIIYGKNESGKSTLLNYIKNIFYGISKNKNGKEISDYEKYYPWSGKEFSGKIKYSLDNGEQFEVFRDFNKKNPKVYNSNLEDITKEFDIDKKDGVQFFYNQTKIDESMFISTIVSMQQEVKLDKQSQSMLVQKIANLAGTGEDGVSYKKAMDKLNKIQTEEIGTSRTQGRPINIIEDRLKDITFVKKDMENSVRDKDELYENKRVIEKKVKEEQTKNNVMRELNMLTQKNKIEYERINFKNKIKKEKEEKIKELINKRNNLIENSSQKNKPNKKIFLFIFIILINLIFIKNNLIKYSIILLIGIIYCFFNFRNKIKEKNKSNNIDQILNTQIELLEKEKNKLIKEIEEENSLINLEINSEKEKIKNKYNDIEINKLINLLNIGKEISNSHGNDVTDLIGRELENSNNLLNKYKIELNKIEFEEKNILSKLENMISLKEEYETLEEQLKEINKKNKTINLAKEFLNKAYEKMKKNVTPKFTQNLSNNINQISNGKYNKVSINDETGLMVELENGEYISADRLSIGTIDQLYLSLRLSMIHEISEEKMPIILDEAFAYYDSERLENILKHLLDNLKENQIIIFTCTRREKEILDKLNVEYNLIELV